MNNPYTDILRLARFGSLERAWALMEERGLLDCEGDERALTLQGRLVKDRAKRAAANGREEESRALFAQSSALYAQAGKLRGGSYPLINAATLSLLAGDATLSQNLAHETLAALDAKPEEAETPYWLGATRAEALLLLRQFDEGQEALRNAIAAQPQAWEDHAATIGQCELLAQHLDVGTAWLEDLRPPATLSYTGIRQVASEDEAVKTRIERLLKTENIHFAYGALASGSDIWVAEAVVAKGGELHAVLPCTIEVFRKVSVASHGSQWGARFDALIAQAESLTILDSGPDLRPGAIALAEAVAEGMARQRAQLLCTRRCRLHISGKGENGAPVHEGAMHLETARDASTRPSKSGSAGRLEGEEGPFAILLQDGSLRRFDYLEDAYCAWREEQEGREEHVGHEEQDGQGGDDGAPPCTRSPDAFQNGREIKGAALDILIPQSQENPRAVPAERSTRLEAMARCAQDGQCLVSFAAAYALKAALPHVNIGEAGTMRWAGGSEALWVVE